MSILKNFWPPANQQDFPSGSQEETLFLEQWNTNCNGWSQQGILGNPWNATHSSPQNFYFNLLTTDVPQPATIQAITWGAFPNRINWYFSKKQNPKPPFQLDQTQLWQLADGGPMAVTNQDGTPFFTDWPQIPSNVCSDPCPPGASTTPQKLVPFGPYGPRGWLDEYCEWSVTRNEQGKITRIDYTCENAEYWYTLWRIDPQTVLNLYRDTLGNQNIQLEDLQLTYNGAAVIDPSTGQPAYNPLNKWNSGTVTTPTAGGAMHLTSTPNTLQTEMGLASGATVARQTCENNQDVLICCSQYGQFQRNSDPHIGFTVNGLVVNGGMKVALSNPPGLYIQMPDAGTFNSSAKLPPNAPAGRQPMDYFRVARGVLTLQDQDGNTLPTNCILHLVFEVPDEDGFTVGDIQLLAPDQQTFLPIQYAAQVSEYLNMGLNGTGVLTNETQPALPCVGSPDVSFAAPLQMMYADLWEAYYGTPVDIPGLPASVQMNIASDTSMAAANVAQGQSGLKLVLAGATITDSPLPVVNAMTPDPDNAANDQIDDTITITVDSVAQVTYATPGNTYPSPGQVIYVTVSVAADSPPGLRDIQIINSGQTAAGSVPGRALLNVVAPRTNVAATQTDAAEPQSSY